MKAPKPCPFCGVVPVWHEDQVDTLFDGSAMVMLYWWHPETGCFLDRSEICVDDVPSWNQRV